MRATAHQHFCAGETKQQGIELSGEELFSILQQLIFYVALAYLMLQHVIWWDQLILLMLQ